MEETTAKFSVSKPYKGEIIPIEGSWLLPGVHIEAQLPSFRCELFIGLWAGYKVGNKTPMEFTADQVLAVCDQFVQEYQIGVDTSHNVLVYPGGHPSNREPGMMVGVFNNPRRPRTNPEVKQLAVQLGCRLLLALQQDRVYLACSDGTHVLKRSPEASHPDS